MKLSPRLVLCAIPLALAACQGEKKTAEASTAQGEILPGSASDSMLPLDSLRSQPPLAPVEVASGKPGKAAASGGAATAEDDATADEESVAPAPATTPTIAADPVQ